MEKAKELYWPSAQPMMFTPRTEFEGDTSSHSSALLNCCTKVHTSEKVL